MRIERQAPGGNVVYGVEVQLGRCAHGSRPVDQERKKHALDRRARNASVDSGVKGLLIGAGSGVGAELKGLLIAPQQTLFDATMGADVGAATPIVGPT